MDVRDRALVLDSLLAFEPGRDDMMDALYDTLFAEAPETKALFIGDMGAQMRRFAQLMERLARDGLEPHAEELRALGRRHARLGVSEDDHAALRLALHASMRRVDGAVRSRDVAGAWVRLCDAAWALMREGAQSPLAHTT